MRRDPVTDHSQEDERHVGIEVIGAGFGRTGTESLKRALEALGYSPCYHMHEVFLRPADAPRWVEAYRTGAMDWPALLEGYRAAVDWPAAFFWRELLGCWPQARVILTVRDARAWYASISKTIFMAQRLPLPPPDEPAHAVQLMARALVRDVTFGDRLDDAAHVIGVYERHNAEVTRSVPAGQLLVYDVAQGWAPLCAFLGQPVPDEPFPRGNTTEDFLARVRERAP